MASEMIHVRVDDKVKRKATRALESMGLSMSDAVRLFLHRIVTDQALPFELKVPNTTTRKAMTEAGAIARAHRKHFTSADELFTDLEKSSRK